MIKFAYTILYVTDVEKTIRFYETAFNFTRRFISPDNQYGELISGETTLSFASASLAKSNIPGGFIESKLSNKPFAQEIGFTCADVADTVNKAVKAGAILVENPVTKPWGQTVAYIRDPEGFLIEICTPMAQ